MEHRIRLHTKLSVFAFISLAFFACESSEDPVIDCSTANLTVTVSNIANATCGNPTGSITVSGSGGSGAYTFSIDGTNFQSGFTFDQLTAGSYNVTIKDENGCTSTTPGEVTDESPLSVTINSTTSDCGSMQGSLTVAVSGGTPAYMYKIGNASFQPSNTFNNLAPDTYSVTVQDGSGCETVVSHRVQSNTSWSMDIMPIINTRCAIPLCHDGSGGLPNWTILTNVQDNAARIKARTAAKEMPPPQATPLTDEQIALIGCWVDDGAQDN